MSRLALLLLILLGVFHSPQLLWADDDENQSQPAVDTDRANAGNDEEETISDTDDEDKDEDAGDTAAKPVDETKPADTKTDTKPLGKPDITSTGA